MCMVLGLMKVLEGSQEGNSIQTSLTCMASCIYTPIAMALSTFFLPLPPLLPDLPLVQSLLDSAL